MKAPRRVRHGDVVLALQEVHAGAGLPLLLLHELYGSGASWTDAAASWPGPAHALDFAGHGASGRRVGGGYTPELFAGDADAALAAIGPCAVAGAGLGAWVGLLLAGARPESVSGVLLLPGAGLDGGGASPGGRAPRLPGDDAPPGVDPAVGACDRDLRPVDYARAFGARARRVLLAGDGAERPPWWTALRDLETVVAAPADRRAALALLAGAVGR